MCLENQIITNGDRILRNRKTSVSFSKTVFLDYYYYYYYFYWAWSIKLPLQDLRSCEHLFLQSYRPEG